MKYEIKNFRPIFDNVIVESIKITEKDGFVRPQGEEDKAQLGKVLKVGCEGPVKVGDIVLMSPYSTNSQDLGKELILKLEDIWAVLDEEQS